MSGFDPCSLFLMLHCSLSIGEGWGEALSNPSRNLINRTYQPPLPVHPITFPASGFIGVSLNGDHILLLPIVNEAAMRDALFILEPDPEDVGATRPWGILNVEF